MDKDSSTSRALQVPSNRISRFGRLGGMTANIAGNMAVNGLAQLGQGQRPSMRNLLLTPRNIGRVAEQLAQMRGAAMKIGQLVSMDTGEVLPPELAQIMARLRDDAHFMPPNQLKQVLSAGWGDAWLGSFRNFNVRPIAAASIGQVHRATLKDGRDLAIKVQYPGVAKSIDSDVANVGALMRLSGLLPKGFELAPYLDEARKQLHEETDYALEAQQMQRFAQLLEGREDFIVPEFYLDFSTPDILAMSFVEGAPIESLMDQPQATRDHVAQTLIKLTLEELFDFGFMQTDPNFANYRYNYQSQKIVLLDFGATRQIDPVIADQYMRLLQAGLAGDTARLTDLGVEIGFFTADTDPAHRTQILEMMQLVFLAIKNHRPYDFVTNDLSAQMQQRGMALAESGFVPPPLPLDILLLQRKFGGIFLLAKRLGAQVDLMACLDAHLTR
ncbi:ABC1 kinase family protein [Algirhabdus cladophorae]|uniref:ABC1 kinase family protein n=1 Tax=Algirhabdus cladophorae TaxID=3377108 RepID=UPI003B84790D